MKIKNIVNIIFIFIIIFIIIFYLFVINKKNIDKFTTPTKKTRLFKAPFPPGILGPNVNTNADSTMQLFNTNGTLSWQQSRNAAKSLGGDLPKLEELRTQLKYDKNAYNSDNKKYNFGELWYPYVDLPDYGWVSFNYSSSTVLNGTTHVSKFGNPQWGITSDYKPYRTRLYVQFVSNKPIPVSTQNIFVDGKKKFDYLTNPNYSNTVLDKYYLNDDQLLSWMPGTPRAIYHPYQVKIGEYYGVVGEQNIPHYNTKHNFTSSKQPRNAKIR